MINNILKIIFNKWVMILYFVAFFCYLYSFTNTLNRLKNILYFFLGNEKAQFIACINEIDDQIRKRIDYNNTDYFIKLEKDIDKKRIICKLRDKFNTISMDKSGNDNLVIIFLDMSISHERDKFQITGMKIFRDQLEIALVQNYFVKYFLTNKWSQECLY